MNAIALVTYQILCMLIASLLISACSTSHNHLSRKELLYDAIKRITFCPEANTKCTTAYKLGKNKTLNEERLKKRISTCLGYDYRDIVFEKQPDDFDISRLPKVELFEFDAAFRPPKIATNEISYLAYSPLVIPNNSNEVLIEVAEVKSGTYVEAEFFVYKLVGQSYIFQGRRCRRNYY